MCIKSNYQFSKCDHVATTLAHCPTHIRTLQELESKGFMDSLFRRNKAPRPQNCGRVIPHYLYEQGYCQECSVKHEKLTSRGVGQGAMQVCKQGFEDALRNERKEAARKALKRNPKTRPGNHKIVRVETSVWLSDLYHHPEALAQKDDYARKPAPAPPVSSRPRKESSARSGNTSMERAKGPAAPEYLPAYGNASPMMKPLPPAPTFKYSGRFANQSSGLPPAVGLPPTPPKPVPTPAARVRGPKHSGAGHSSSVYRKHSQPDRHRHRPKPAHSSHKTHNHQPEHSKKRSQHDSKMEPTRALTREECLPVPITPKGIPTISIYLDDPEFQDPYGDEPPSPRAYKPYWVAEPSRWETRKAALAGWLDKSCDESEGSDVSFVCKTARTMSDQGPRVD